MSFSCGTEELLEEGSFLLWGESRESASLQTLVRGRGYKRGNCRCFVYGQKIDNSPLSIREIMVGKGKIFLRGPFLHFVVQ